MQGKDLVNSDRIGGADISRFSVETHSLAQDLGSTRSRLTRLLNRLRGLAITRLTVGDIAELVQLSPDNMRPMWSSWPGKPHRHGTRQAVVQLESIRTLIAFVFVSVLILINLLLVWSRHRLSKKHPERKLRVLQGVH